jgi:hypothetical protein
MVFGAAVIAFPGAGALALVWLVSLYATVTGLLLLALGIGTWRAGRAGAAGGAAGTSTGAGANSRGQATVGTH